MPVDVAVNDLDQTRIDLSARLASTGSGQMAATIAKTLHGVISKIGGPDEADRLREMRNQLRTHLADCTNDQTFTILSAVLVTVAGKIDEIDPPPAERRDLALDRFVERLQDRLNGVGKVEPTTDHSEHAGRFRIEAGGVETLGDLAGRFVADYGLTPDPWQQMILDSWLARRVDGTWAALTCGVSVSRQNGKNALLEMRELFGMVGLGEKILHSAHQVPTARKHFKRLKHFFGIKVNDPDAIYPELNALVIEMRNTNGQEGIFLNNGASIEIAARAGGAGRGFTVDVMVFDEAQDLAEDDLEALLSTSSSPPLGNPQWFYTGTPPGPQHDGEVFTRIRDEALGAEPWRLCWHEWSPDEGADSDDREMWLATNPGIEAGRLLTDVIIGERARFSDAGFWRERLGGWADGGSAEVIGSATWSAVADENSKAVERLVLGIDVGPDRSTASVCLAGIRADGKMHVELDETRAGTGWLPAYIVERCAQNPIAAVVVDATSPAASIVDELTTRKVKVQVTTAREMAAACGRFYDAVMEGQIRHLNQPQLNAARAGARKRPLGDAWAWNRKNSTIDITPLVAGTLAVWGLKAAKVKTKSNRTRKVLSLS